MKDGSYLEKADKTFKVGDFAEFNEMKLTYLEIWGIITFNGELKD